MLDLSIVQESYSRMSDEQLLSFALNEGHQISSDAFVLLRNEFIKRNLDLTALETSEQNRQLQQQEKMKKIDESSNDDFLKSTWNFVFRQILNGKSDEEILNGLIKNDVSEKQALTFVKNSRMKAEEYKDIHENQITIGWISIIVCIVLLILTLNFGRGVLAYGALIFGGYKLSQGYSKIGLYKGIIKILDEKQ